MFRTLRYDNLKACVIRILRGRQRQETERIISFRSHWAFRASTAIAEEFCPLIVDGRGRVRVKTKFYSAPVPPGPSVTAATGPLWMTIHHQNRCVARHLRHYGRGHQILDLCARVSPAATTNSAAPVTR